MKDEIYPKNTEEMTISGDWDVDKNRNGKSWIAPDNTSVKADGGD